MTQKQQRDDCIALISSTLDTRYLADFAYQVKRHGTQYNLPWQDLYNSTATEIAKRIDLPADFWVGTSGTTILDDVLSEGLFS